LKLQLGGPLANSQSDRDLYFDRAVSPKR